MSASRVSRPRALRCASDLAALAAPVALASAAVFAVTPRAVQAQAVAPTYFASVEGEQSFAFVDSSNARTYQEQIASSVVLSGFQVGDQIKGISFRLDNNATAPTADLNFTSYQITLSQAAKPFGSFDPIFANNIGANAAVVYDNSLTLAASSFKTGGSGGNGGTPNPFGPTINFSSAYTYQGGDLVITIRHSGNGAANPFLDSTSNTAHGFNSEVYARGALGQTATTANGSAIAQILRLNNTVITEDTPEPPTLPLAFMGLLIGAGVASRTRRRLPSRIAVRNSSTKTA